MVGLTSLEQIIEAEEALRQAMLTSDVVALESLISPELVFINHLGQPMTRSDDLTAHRDGIVNIEVLTPCDQVIKICGENAIVFVKMRLAGQFAGRGFAQDLRFMRVWAITSDWIWQVVAGQATVVADIN